MPKLLMIFTFFSSLFISFTSLAAVYRCEVNGVQTFSQTPCGIDGGKEIEVAVSKPQQSIDANEKDLFVNSLDELSNERTIRDHQYRIKALKQQITTLSEQARNEADQILIDNRNELRNATNEHAQALYDSKINVIKAKYMDEIQGKKDEIKQLEAKIEELQG
ncbi:hypothetical protein [Corallincola spongiicola]|uniref:DUF4124 domain-containing protein n=1 Tax=Corallincola spongiicola TaxID=2520508 RepID=A0ABY1WQV6_9GAMM|nr:hypothetical protein [Corallincola spongiicola]TAA46983.1 hypothetical protein EXY25_06950 [Corallincola spongiicola]